MMMKKQAMLVYVAVLVAASLVSKSNAFSIAGTKSTTRVLVVQGKTALSAYSASSSSSSNSNSNDNFWLKDFAIASGEIIDPYAVLKVPRKAEMAQIRQSYIQQSRRYHPDGARHRKFLPGSCNNIDEVRDQWERIKLAYEILKNPQMRKRYDRHEALSDPGRAVRRAATDAALQSVFGLGKGLFDVGALAVEAIKSQAMTTVSNSGSNNNNNGDRNGTPVTTAAEPLSQKLAP